MVGRRPMSPCADAAAGGRSAHEHADLGVASICIASATAAPLAQTAAPGRVQFERLCAVATAPTRAAAMGPGIVSRLALRTDDELATLVRDGLPAKGMPGHALVDADMQALVAYARTLRPGARRAPARLSVTMTDGGAVHGVVLNRTATDAQLLADGDLHLLRRAGDAWRRVTSQADWPTYHGDRGGNRYSTVDQINRGTVARLGAAVGVPAAWRLEPAGDAGRGRRGDGVTNANECFALDAGSGRRIWHYQRPRTKGLPHDAASGINRGAAVDGDRLHGHRPRASHRAEPLHRRSRGRRRWPTGGRTTGHVGAARRRQPGRVGDLGRRRRRPRVPRRVRSRDRQGSVAVLDGAAARRARLRDLARLRDRARLRRDVADRHLGPGPADALLADRQPVPRLRRLRGRATTLFDSILALDPATGRPSGTSSTRRTTSGTGTRSSRRC